MSEATFVVTSALSIMSFALVFTFWRLQNLTAQRAARGSVRHNRDDTA